MNQTTLKFLVCLPRIALSPPTANPEAELCHVVNAAFGPTTVCTGGSPEHAIELIKEELSWWVILI
jgi:hypothetical protein